MRRSAAVAALLVTFAASLFAYHALGRNVAKPDATTTKVTRGDVVEMVGATGQLQAVTTVQVGSQVSGTILELKADFNSLVRKGQVLARLDPSLLQTQIEQARANLIRAQADLDRLRVASEDAETKLRRAQDLSEMKLIATADLDAAEVAVRSAEAQRRSQAAAVTQAQASLGQSEVNLRHTVIEAPIDGLVISRDVDVGQTVAASMSAPTLFLLAADLTKMQVVASIDESDVGRIRPGQIVRFSVDAFPNEEFAGTVTQVRLQPQTVQNVVTYSTVIDVPNARLQLKPGMTANVSIEVARRDNVLRVPNAALRFRPSDAAFAALGQARPAVAGKPRGGEEGQAPVMRAVDRETGGATTFDALFGPLPSTESAGQIWLYQDGALNRVGLRLGITDGRQTEVLEASNGIQEGAEPVTSFSLDNQPATPVTGGSAFPGLGGGGPGPGFPGR